MLYQKLLDAHKRYRQFKTYPHIADQYWSSQLAEHNINPIMWNMMLNLVNFFTNH